MIEPAPSPAPASAACVTLEAGDPSTVTVGPGAIEIEPAADAALRLRRYATGSFQIDLGPATARKPVVLTFPDDNATVRWTLGVSSDHPARVCAL